MNQKEQAHYDVCQEYLGALLGALKEKTGYNFTHLASAWSPPNACGKLEVFILENNILDFGPIWQKYKKRYASTWEAMKVEYDDASYLVDIPEEKRKELFEKAKKFREERANYDRKFRKKEA